MLQRSIVAAIAVYAAALLWPYDFEAPRRIENGAAPAQLGGLRFETPGLATSDRPQAWAQEAMRTQRLELRLSLRSEAIPKDELEPILTLSRHPYHRDLAVGQDGRDLVVRLRTPDSAPKGGTYFVGGVFSTPRWIEVAIAIEPRRLRIAVDGLPRVDRELPERPLSTWDASYPLTLGNEPAGNRPWLGELRHAIVQSGDVRIDLADPGVLQRPARYWYVKTPPQLVPLRDSSPDDVLVNGLLYVPLGLLLGARRRATGGRARPRPWVCILLVSGSLEFLQLFVSIRCLSTGDLCLNVLGGLLGAWLGGVLMTSWMARHRPTPATAAAPRRA